MDPSYESNWGLGRASTSTLGLRNGEPSSQSKSSINRADRACCGSTVEAF
jgi:hypothetical protein